MCAVALPNEGAPHCTAGPLLVTQQLHKQGLLGGKAGSSLIANMTSKASCCLD